MYTALGVIAKAIKMQEEVSLEKIVIKLHDAQLVKPGIDAVARTMVFTLSG